MELTNKLVPYNDHKYSNLIKNLFFQIDKIEKDIENQNLSNNNVKNIAKVIYNKLNSIILHSGQELNFFSIESILVEYISIKNIEIHKQYTKYNNFEIIINHNKDKNWSYIVIELINIIFKEYGIDYGMRSTPNSIRIIIF